ncbi:MAG: hypothetical protein IJI27_05365 [Oscillospiraceae bacterium]|nr:hypothetical protein [Oscillospiraceae bacterium]
MKKILSIILILLICAFFVGFFKPVHAAEPCKVIVSAPEGELNLTVGSPKSACDSLIANIEMRSYSLKGCIEIDSNNEQYLSEMIYLLEQRGYDCHSIHEPLIEWADAWYCLEEDGEANYIQLTICK